MCFIEEACQTGSLQAHEALCNTFHLAIQSNFDCSCSYLTISVFCHYIVFEKGIQFVSFALG